LLCSMNYTSGKAQGSLEYLLLIGGAVLIAAVVLFLLGGTAGQGGDVVESRASEAYCSAMTRKLCGIRDPDGVSPLIALDCFWEGQSQSCVPSTLGQGIQGWWRFENNDARIVSDSSGNGNTGTNNNAVQGAGIIGKGYQFNGVDSHLSFNTTSFQNTLSNFSVSMWVTPDDISTLKGLFSRLNGHQLYPRARITPEGNVFLQFQVNGTTHGTTTTNQPITVNTTHHIVITVDNVGGNIVNIYVDAVDGIPDRTRNVEDGVVSRGNRTPAFFIGTNNLFAGAIRFPFSGVIDEVLVWDRVLTPQEVQQLATARG
jgi:hypothetical protein